MADASQSEQLAAFINLFEDLASRSRRSRRGPIRAEYSAEGWHPKKHWYLAGGSEGLRETFKRRATELAGARGQQGDDAWMKLLDDLKKEAIGFEGGGIILGLPTGDPAPTPGLTVDVFESEGEAEAEPRRWRHSKAPAVVTRPSALGTIKDVSSAAAEYCRVLTARETPGDGGRPAATAWSDETLELAEVGRRVRDGGRKGRARRRATEAKPHIVRAVAAKIRATDPHLSERRLAVRVHKEMGKRMTEPPPPETIRKLLRADRVVGRRADGAGAPTAPRDK